MNKKYKSSRSRMENRPGAPPSKQDPGVYKTMNSKQEEVTVSNRARRRVIAAIKRKSDKRKALEPLPTGPTEIGKEDKV